MTARLLLEIALRVLGFWFFFSSISGLTMAVTTHLQIFAMPGWTNYVLGLFATIIVQFLLGAALVFWAPAIAARFYPSASEGGESRIAVGPGDVYRIACFVLGAYLLVTVAGPAGRLVSAGVSGAWRSGSSAGDAATIIVQVASGLLLVFGSRRIGEIVSNLRYDPNTVPTQQISLAMLLIVVVLIAVVLGVVRWMSLGPI